MYFQGSLISSVFCIVCHFLKQHIKADILSFKGIDINNTELFSLNLSVIPNAHMKQSKDLHHIQGVHYSLAHWLLELGLPAHSL